MSRRKSSVKETKKASVKKTRKPGELHTWQTYVIFYRDAKKDPETGEKMKFSEALKQAKEPWLVYKARHGLDVPKVKKTASSPDLMTWSEFIAEWRETHPEYSFKDALTAAGADWREYKTAHGL